MQRRSQMNRGKPMRRRRMKPPKLTAERQEKRETRKSWAVRGKEREPQCRRCGNWIWLESHHMLARSGGGSDEDWNHITLCFRCHGWTHNHRIEAQALGLLAHVGDCSELPV